jgi:hypothetical protein
MQQYHSNTEIEDILYGTTENEIPKSDHNKKYKTINGYRYLRKDADVDADIEADYPYLSEEGSYAAANSFNGYDDGYENDRENENENENENGQCNNDDNVVDDTDEYYSVDEHEEAYARIVSDDEKNKCSNYKKYVRNRFMGKLIDETRYVPSTSSQSSNIEYVSDAPNDSDTSDSLGYDKRLIFQRSNYPVQKNTINSTNLANPTNSINPINPTNQTSLQDTNTQKNTEMNATNNSNNLLMITHVTNDTNNTNNTNDTNDFLLSDLIIKHMDSKDETTFVIKDKNIRELPEIMKTFTKIKELELKNCKLISLKNLPPNIEKLDVSSNCLTELMSDDIPSSVVSMSAANNFISIIDLSGSVKLKILDISANVLDTLLVFPPFVETIYAMGSKYLKNMEAFSILKNLKSLNLNDSCVTNVDSLPDTITFLSICKVFGWDNGNVIRKLPKNLVDFKCKSSGLKGFAFVEFPEHLRTLDLYGNEITYLPILPNNIVHVDISNNWLSKVANIPTNVQNYDCNGNICLKFSQEQKDTIAKLQQKLVTVVHDTDDDVINELMNANSLINELMNENTFSHDDFDGFKSIGYGEAKTGNNNENKVTNNTEKQNADESKNIDNKTTDTEKQNVNDSKMTNNTEKQNVNYSKITNNINNGTTNNTENSNNNSNNIVSETTNNTENPNNNSNNIVSETTNNIGKQNETESKNLENKTTNIEKQNDTESKNISKPQDSSNKETENKSSEVVSHDNENKSNVPAATYFTGRRFNCSEQNTINNEMMYEFTRHRMMNNGNRHGFGHFTSRLFNRQFENGNENNNNCQMQRQQDQGLSSNIMKLVFSDNFTPTSDSKYMIKSRRSITI